MQYEPIKRSLGHVFTGPLLMRKILYSLLDLLLLRTWHVKRALRVISPNLGKEATVLDAGSGFGQYTWRMSRMNRKWKIRGLDINQEHIDECRRFFRAAGMSDRVFFETADLTLLNETESYDLILSVDVMEHIKEDETVFKNFCRALKPGGMLLISTPSDRGCSDVNSGDDHSFIDEHVRDGYGIEEITRKLTVAGFSTVTAKYTYGKPGNISWKMSMKLPVMMLNRTKLLFLILPFYYMLVFPFSLILNTLDVSLTHNTGTGLLVSARK